MDVDAPVEFVNSPVNSPAVEASPPASAAEDDAFERMLSAALKETRGASTPIEKQPLDRAVPKREFKPKLEVKSPEKYEPAAKPTPSTSALDFEAKLEAAMRAAEAGGDLTAILSGPSSKTANSPVGYDECGSARELSRARVHEGRAATSLVARRDGGGGE